MRKYLLVTAILVVAALFAGAFLGPLVFKSPLTSAEERWFFSPRSDYTMTLEHQVLLSLGRDRTR